MSKDLLTTTTPPPSGQGVMFYTLDRAGNMTPVCRIERRADEPWGVFSGEAAAQDCLEPLEEAHECCLKVAMSRTVAKALAERSLRKLPNEEAGA